MPPRTSFKRSPKRLALENKIEQWIETQPEFGVDLAEMLQFAKTRHMSEKMHQAMKAIYAAHPNLVPSLVKAIECPDYDARLDYSSPPEQLTAQLLPIIQNARGITRVLAYHARLAAIDGDCDEAARMALATFKLTRHIERNPSIVSYLVAITIRSMAVEEANFALQAGPVSKELRQSLDAELAIQERMDGYVWAIKSGRAYEIDSFNRFPLRNFWLYSRGHWNRQESEYLDAFAFYLALAPDGRPYPCPSNPHVDDGHGAGYGECGRDSFCHDEGTNDDLLSASAQRPADPRAGRRPRNSETYRSRLARRNDYRSVYDRSAGPRQPAAACQERHRRVGSSIPLVQTAKMMTAWSKISRNGDIGIGPPIPAAKADEPRRNEFHERFRKGMPR